MTEEVHIPAKAAVPLVITITPPVAQDNSTPSISEQDNSYKENIDVLQTDKPQQELNDIRKDSKSGFFGFSLTKKNADKYKMEREIEKIKHEAEMKLHKQLSSVEQKYKSQITQLENREVSQSTRMENLESSLAKTEAERNSLKTQLEKQSSEKNKSYEENKRLQISLGKVGAERDSFKDQLEKLEKKSSEKERSDKEKSEEIKRLQISLAKAEAERDSQKAANKNHEALMSRISQLENAVNVAKAKNEEILKMSGDVRRIVMENSSDLRNLHSKPTEMTLRARFSEISNLTRTSVYCQRTDLGGIKWRIHIYKNDDCLAFFLSSYKENAEKWSCSAFTEYQLISPESGEVVKTKKSELLVHTEKCACGYTKFISFKDLFDNGYVKDDSILLAAVVRVFPTA